jgi:hypothetical protein
MARRLLGPGLQRNKPHCRPRGRLNDGFSVGNIILLSFYKRLHIIWRNQSHRVPQLLDLSSSAMSCSTGLHRNKTNGLLAHKCEKLNTRQLFAKNNRSVSISPVKLENALCKVYADHGNF